MKNGFPQASRLSVSLVVYHSPVTLLRATVDSLLASARVALAEGVLADVLVTVVDNSQSPDYGASVREVLESVELSEFFTVRYVEAGQNDGFAGGHNLALTEVGSDYHLVLNPDVELASSALSAGLSALQRDPGLVLVSPRVVGSTGEQEFLCKSYPSVLVLLLRAFAPAAVRARFRSRLDRYELRALCSGDQADDVLLASGCFMLVRTSALTQVCGFNDKYFLYFEDFDLSLRLRDLGRLTFQPAMQITHHGGYAASKGTRHIWLFIKSGFRFFNDHGWKWI